ncbi:MAG: helix-turn-helix domain-containing protein [Phycisphaerae bacterium]|nr:helix-turn-helix domain-containing protein [Phycisphaerae bacterium]
MKPTDLQTKPNDPPRLALSPREAAKALSISERTLWTMTKSGRVPHTRIGARVVYPVDALRRWLDEQAAKGGAG